MGATSNPNISIRGICEQDIDLLLLEEFVASVLFRRWFFKKVKISPSAELLKAERSVWTITGESDLELTLSVGGKTIKLLIENKVDAPVQPGQPDRYRERAKEYCADGKCDRVVAVVVAPSVYFIKGERHGYDYHIPYEEVLIWFQTAAFSGKRRAYKMAVLNQAIERGRHGWHAVPDAKTTTFWQRYWDSAEQIAPVLRMPRPEPKPARSSFIRFQPFSLGPDAKLLHKVRHGRVDLQIGGMAAKLALVQNKFGNHMTKSMRIEKANKSAVIRILVPRINVKSPFIRSKQAVEIALFAALSLLKVYESVQTG